MATYMFFLLIVVVTASSNDYGPYKIIVTDITNRCNRTVRPYEKVASVVANFWVDSMSMLNGNLTALEDVKNLRGILHLYQQENGKWNLLNRIDKLNCRSILMPTLMKIFGYKPWKDFCTVKKGTYFIRNVDSNKAYHLWNKELPYGYSIKRFEFVKRANTVFCCEITMNAIPEA